MRRKADFFAMNSFTARAGRNLHTARRVACISGEHLIQSFQTTLEELNMALKIVYDANGNPRKRGRKKSDPAKLAKVLPLKKYITAKLPAPPAGTNNAAGATEALSQMYENDQLGDCVIGGCGHVEGVITANAADQVVYTDDQIITEYEVCGYDPSRGATRQQSDRSGLRDRGRPATRLLQLSCVL
jgi:hypothetical protein